jgi:hypothetical protein
MPYQKSSTLTWNIWYQMFTEIYELVHKQTWHWHVNTGNNFRLCASVVSDTENLSLIGSVCQKIGSVCDTYITYLASEAFAVIILTSREVLSEHLWIKIRVSWTTDREHFLAPDSVRRRNIDKSGWETAKVGTESHWRYSQVKTALLPFLCWWCFYVLFIILVHLI